MATRNGDNQELHAAWLRIAHAFMTVGRGPYGRILDRTVDELVEATLRGFKTVAYLTSSDSDLTLRSTFHHLDASEKAGRTYDIGMALTALVYRQLLGVPWLRHIDPLVRSGAAILTAGDRRRGDMVGEDSAGGAHVVETKGRSTDIAIDVVTDAKRDQAAKVLTVGGAAPVSTAACGVFTRATPITAVVIDPEPKEGSEVRMSPGAVIRSQLAPWVAALNSTAETTTVHGMRFRITPTALAIGSLRGRRVRVRVGVADDVVAHWGHTDFAAAARAFANEWAATQRARADVDEESDVSADGTVVLT